MPSVNANAPSSDVVALAPAPAAPPPTLAMVSRQMGDSKPPQAIVKPQILTHIIEGFVIQEGAEPFPVRAGPEAGGLPRGALVSWLSFQTPQNRKARKDVISSALASSCDGTDWFNSLVCMVSCKEGRAEKTKNVGETRKWKCWKEKMKRKDMTLKLSCLDKLGCFMTVVVEEWRNQDLQHRCPDS